MDIKFRTAGPVIVVELAGELTWRTADDVQTQIGAAVSPGSRLVLDMSRVSHLDSAALHFLLAFHQTIANRRSHACLAGAPDALKKMMNVTGFSDIFHQSDSVDAGIANLAS
jgi:anti-anti-sigma factor